MAPINIQHRRTHNLLLISKLLNQKEATSPFSLVIDDLEQSGKPLIREYIKRATAANNEIIYVSYETLRRPEGVDVFIPAWKEPFATVQKTIATHTDPKTSTRRKVLIIDTLNPLCSDPSTASNLPEILSSFFSPNASLVALYHSDIPVAPSLSSLAAYTPHPLTLLKYLATTIFTTHSLHHVLARKAARERSVAEPVFGLGQGIEGILVGRDGNGKEGLVLEMEYRRKSGRGVRESYFLPHPSRRAPQRSSQASTGHGKGGALHAASARNRETVMLLEDHPLYRRPEEDTWAKADEGGDMDVTFELGITERQRRDREGVVLPYFDAQKGGGEGGRILYDMGEEDDFDEEEDEI